MGPLCGVPQARRDALHGMPALDERPASCTVASARIHRAARLRRRQARLCRLYRLLYSSYKLRLCYFLRREKEKQLLIFRKKRRRPASLDHLFSRGENLLTF